jgi:hypothetical protein
MAASVSDLKQEHRMTFTLPDLDDDPVLAAT